jgi:hypothetical protein
LRGDNRSRALAPASQPTGLFGPPGINFRFGVDWVIFN